MGQESDQGIWVDDFVRSDGVHVAGHWRKRGTHKSATAIGSTDVLDRNAPVESSTIVKPRESAPAEQCSTCGQFKGAQHTCRAAAGVVKEPKANAAAQRCASRHGDVEVTEYVPLNGKTSWSVSGPQGTYLVTPAGRGFEVCKSYSVTATKTCADVGSAISTATSRASDLPSGLTSSETRQRHLASSLERMEPAATITIPALTNRAGEVLADPVTVDHAEVAPGRGTFIVSHVDGDSMTNVSEWTYGPRAALIDDPYGSPVSKAEAAARAAEEAGYLQQPIRCSNCGRYMALDGEHACPPSSSAAGELPGGGMSPAAPAVVEVVDQADSETPSGLPAGNYAGMKADERVKAMVADLEESVKSIAESGQLGRWLDAMSSNGMARWSANNRLLAMVQMMQRGEDINHLHLMGFRQWENFNRKVSKGAKAVWILAPMTKKFTEEDEDGKRTEKNKVIGFKGVPVFNVSDTSGDPMPESPAQPARGHTTPGTLQGLRDRVGQAGYAYEELEIPDCRPETGDGTLGYTDPKTKKIVVDSRLSEAQKAATIAHELGHVHCGHVDGDYSEYRRHRGRMETEAEMAGYLVMRGRGASKDQADAFSPGYIAGWSRGDASVMHGALDKAVKAHNKIMDGPWPTN